MAFLSSLLGLDAGKATQAAAKKNQTLLGDLQTRGTGYIDTGEQKSAGYLGQATQQFAPWQQTGQAANAMVGNALGLNGPNGNSAAQDAFQAGPGYQYALDQQLKAAERGASAGGMLGSGNLLTALQDRAAGVANQEYGSWLDRLTGQSSQGLEAAAGTAGGYRSLASLFQDTAGQRLGLDASVTQGRMGANNQYAEGGEMNAAGLANLGQSLGGLIPQTKFGKFLGFL